jgi:hypothetical protein
METPATPDLMDSLEMMEHPATPADLEKEAEEDLLVPQDSPAALGILAHPVNPETSPLVALLQLVDLASPDAPEVLVNLAILETTATMEDKEHLALLVPQETPDAQEILVVPATPADLATRGPRDRATTAPLRAHHLVSVAEQTSSQALNSLLSSAILFLLVSCDSMAYTYKHIHSTVFRVEFL